MKKVQAKILLSLLLSLMLVIGVIPFGTMTAFAANAANETNLINYVKKGGAVKLTKDIALTKELLVPAGVEVSLDLNGKTLSRALADCEEDGSVIFVEAGGALTLTDSSGNNAGTITGGAAFNGGGICNNGTLVFEGGTVKGNMALDDAEGNGGGIYNAGTLTLCGGVIANNEARNGGGICNAADATMAIEQKEVTKKVGIESVTYTYNVRITGNTAENLGHGIYNDAELSLGGAPEIYDNEDNDIFNTRGKVITISGELKNSKKISVKSSGTNTVITSNYSVFNTKKPTTYFTSSDPNAVLRLTAVENGEVMLKNDTDSTIIEVYESQKLVKREETDSTDFVSIWNKALSYSKDNKSVWGFVRDDSVVEITLGKDFSYDKNLDITAKRNIVIDLNGHYIKRAGKKQKNGYLFKVGENAKFTVNDSNPSSKGYKDHKGGVLADGNGDDCGGGIIVDKYADFYMLGGTIYNCVTDYHGGAVYAGSDLCDIFMQNCTIDACQTKDSGDDCHGGGIYVKNASNVILKNVNIKNCKSEDKGGALYLRERPRNVNLKNVYFSDNFANDGGGAIFIDDLKSDTEFTFEAESCNFVKNSAKANGGAVYVYDDDESEYKNPTIFRDCTFTENESTKYGGAMEVNDNGVVLSGGTFTKNKAGGKGGAIYVEGEYDISVAGKLIIKDNDGKDNYDNLCLEENSDHKAYVYDAGLYNGSYIKLSTSNNKTGIAAVKDVGQYQTKYFYAEKGSLNFKKTGTREASMVTASLFGEGSLKIIIIIAVAGILLAIGAVIVVKKRKGVDSDDDEDEDE